MKSSIRSRTSGLTLVEVVISIVLLSTLLTGMLVAHSRHIRQMTKARQIRRATELADELIATWFSSDEPFAGGIQGVFAADSEFYWTTDARLGGTDNLNWRTQVVSVQVFHRAVNDASPLVSVEMIEALPEDPRPASDSPADAPGEEQ